VRGTGFAIVAVGTLDEGGGWTGDVVRRAVLDLVSDADAPRQIVVRSTLMPGTAQALATELAAMDPGVELAHNPEFTREGSAVNDFLSPDRVVIGLADPGAETDLSRSLRHVYEPLGAPIVVTSLVSAEMIKVASNVFLATKIAFANELARLAAATGADVQAVVDGMGLDRRIGRAFLSPGPGFGGSCLPSQAQALPAHAASHGVTLQLMDAVTGSNEGQAAWCVEQLEARLGRGLAGTRVALLGMTFKAGTNDMRDSPALRLARLLAARGAQLAIYDPASTEAARAGLESEGIAATGALSAVDACRDADAVVIATEWPEFHELDWAAVAEVMSGRVVFDTRNVIDVPAARAAGLDAFVLGGLAD
jgi:UDPglucose 6-dehydrogenase